MLSYQYRHHYGSNGLNLAWICITFAIDYINRTVQMTSVKKLLKPVALHPVTESSVIVFITVFQQGLSGCIGTQN